MVSENTFFFRAIPGQFQFQSQSILTNPSSNSNQLLSVLRLGIVGIGIGASLVVLSCYKENKWIQEKKNVHEYLRGTLGGKRRLEVEKYNKVQKYFKVLRSSSK
jgi:hypothetical protein